MQLAVPLTTEQVAIATRLLERLPDWFVTDRALVAVGERFPGFELAAVLVKAAATNQLYWTRVFAIGSAAQHSVNVMRESPAIDEALVERLTAVPTAPHHKQATRSISFASKFAHFSLSEALPIYDWYADDTVRWHIGRTHAQSSDAHPWTANELGASPGRYAALCTVLDAARRQRLSVPGAPEPPPPDLCRTLLVMTVPSAPGTCHECVSLLPRTQ